MNVETEFEQDTKVLRWLLKRMIKAYGKKTIKHLLDIYDKHFL